MPASFSTVLPPKLEVAMDAPALPAPIMFRAARVPAGGLYPQHRHAWGEFVYAFSGVMEVKLPGHHYLAPSQYGIWLPPGVEHVGQNRLAAWHCSVYVAPQCAQGLPPVACALSVSPLVRALLEHLCQHPADQAGGEAEARLLQVLVDQLGQLPRAGSYLPGSDDPALAAVLRALQMHPGDNRSLAELAESVHTTERTLLRRCQRDLGMPLAAWRQRLRVVSAMPHLEAGRSVEAVALDLGYSSASAFIAMFKRLVGVTPDAVRRGAGYRVFA